MIKPASRRARLWPGNGPELYRVACDLALTGEKFAQYLTEEGLEAVAAIRARRGQIGPVRERFSRCAKSLLLTAKDGTGSDQAVEQGGGIMGAGYSVVVPPLPDSASSQRAVSLRPEIEFVPRGTLYDQEKSLKTRRVLDLRPPAD